MNPAPPAVTIGVPVYNGERHLRQALDALLAQTFTDVEIIVSDNASTDSTPAIIAEYAARDRRIRVLRQSHNIGAMRNWNVLAHAARGRYFKWAPANDFCSPNLIEDCVALLEREPAAVLCYGRTRLIDDEGLPIDGEVLDIEIDQPRPSDRYHQLVLALRLNNPIAGVIRTGALLHTGLVRTYPGGDIPMMLELALAGAFRIAPGATAFRRMGRGFSGNLARGDLQHLIDPQRRSGFRLTRLRSRGDSIAGIARARISAAEKLRALTFAARHVYWELAKFAHQATAMIFAGYSIC